MHGPDRAISSSARGCPKEARRAVATAIPLPGSPGLLWAGVPSRRESPVAARSAPGRALSVFIPVHLETRLLNQSGRFEPAS